jgi:NADH dehydrogenase
VVATGTTHNYFGKDQWRDLAPGLKTVEDATGIRRRILLAFEVAERENDPVRLQAWLTFMVVGGGPTGVELAGAVAEIANDTLKHNFRAINPSDSRVILLEGAGRVLPTYPPELSHRARESLMRLGVQVRTGGIVTDIQDGRVVVQFSNQTETIASHTVLWAAGVRASRLGKVLAQATGCALDHVGRVVVNPDLSIPGHPDIFVIGDLAHAAHQTGQPLPGLAPVAMQEGRYVAATIRRRLRNLPPSAPFHYIDYGTMATIGRGRAVADLGWVHLSGVPAWLAWLFIHLMGLVAFENRLLVLIQWAWNYLTFNRVARLITEDHSRSADGD